MSSKLGIHRMLNITLLSPHNSVGYSARLFVGSIPGQVNLTNINCLSDETLNRDPVGRCYRPSTLTGGALVVSFCILALSPVTTSRLLGASFGWVPGSN